MASQWTGQTAGADKQMQTQTTPDAETDIAANDLGPLAWVLDELRKSLDGASKAMRRFVRDAELARGSDLAELDASQLRIARQQLHQAVGALEMVGLGVPAKLLRGMEALAQKFVQRPELCSDDAANKVERASFAVAEYLEGELKGRKASPVALFPQYRDVLDMVGGDRVHPADLWPHEWRWIDTPIPFPVQALAYGPAVRAKLDQAVLKVVRSGDEASARAMEQISLGLAEAASATEPRVFWKISAAFFEAVRLGLCPSDVFVKRTASRVIAQYTTLARGEAGVIDRLAQDLLFYCAYAVPKQDAAAPILVAVRDAYGLSQASVLDYTTAQYGRFDPAALAQARKRISAAIETWATLSGGDTSRIKPASEQFAAVADSMVRLHPESADLARALTRTLDVAVRTGEPPSASVAMEVATSVLYLEAAYDDLDPTDSKMAQRCSRLAQRLEHVVGGQPPEPLEPWMEELYRRVSDRQTMGSVVDELRTTLGQVEKSLDQFFRNPQERAPLHEVPSQLAQMRGVFSVLGLDQASLAARRMRDSVEQFLVDQVQDSGTAVFEKLGNSLGAMGFLIDMLSYQRALAKQLFVYDEDLGEFRPLMGREKVAVESAPVETGPVVETEVPVPDAAMAPDTPAVDPAAAAPVVETAVPAPMATSEETDEDAEMREIFLDEAREVVQTGLLAVAALDAAPDDLGEQTTLRRAFHTLKGSSRMVGLTEFGEAGWAMEQLVNTWLADQKPASEDLRVLCGEAMRQFSGWVEDIATGAMTPWSAQAFRRSADAMRVDNTYIALLAPGATEEPAPDAAPVAAPVVRAPAQEVEEASTRFATMSAPMETQLETSLEPINDASAAMELDMLAEQSELASLEPAAVSSALDPDAPAESVDSDAVFGALDEPVEAAPAEPDEAVQAGAPFVSTQIPPEPDSAFGPASVPPDFDATQIASGPSESPESRYPNFQQTQTYASSQFGTAADGGDVSAPLSGVGEIDFDFGAPPPPESVLPVPDAEAITEGAALLDESGDAPQEETQEDPVKVIGDLRIGIPLYNVYLNEADEWSRRLLTELSEWAMELDKPILDSTVGLAHSLVGSSATVGFTTVAELARLLELALQHVQLYGQGRPEDAHTFNQAAEEIRRLLHQFAAGFLKDPDPDILPALRQVLETEFDSSPVPLVEPPPVVPATSQAGAAPLIVSSDEHSDAVDALDADLFPIFEEEAAELFPKLGAALRQWVANPEDRSGRTEALRVLHTLKGSARLAGAMRLGDMTHRMESAIESLGSETVAIGRIEPMLGRFDNLQSMFDGLRDFVRRSEQSPAVQADAADGPVMVDVATAEPRQGAAAPLASDQRTRARAAGATAAPRPSAGQSLRVPAQLLDRLVNQAGEVIITRSRLDGRAAQMRTSLKDLTGNLDRLREQLREMEVQSESQMQSRMAQAKDQARDFDPLEFDRFTRVQELTRLMAESVSDVATLQRQLQRSMQGAEDDLIAQARQARELQRDLLRTRMVEFESVSERLYGVVRQTAKETGKQVKLDIEGGSMELDRSVLERMVPAFEHMLRNAIAHGIESPQGRQAAAKPATGSITVALHQEGNDVSVVFGDDGAGLDLERIRAKALSKGLIAAQQTLGDDETASLVFMPGFSTAETVTEISGRGVGLDVVRAEVDALGGRIETTSEWGKGTQFKLVVPLTTAVTQVVMLRLGEMSVGVPSNLVEIVRRVPDAEVVQSYETRHFAHGGEMVPFFWVGALLKVNGASTAPAQKHRAVVLFRSAGRRVAVHVDEVLGNQEVVVKNLGPQLSRMPGLTGMSVLASGAVVLIYNPVALATVYGESALQLQAMARQSTAGAGVDVQGQAPSVAPPAAASKTPLIMVVDDSITVRRVTQRLLMREGYRVVLANDGLQALERLQDELPDVVLSDIEMPRMDGFDLARNIRGDDRMRGLPIIMITSRIAEKHREHAIELGVDHYLGKPYSEEELLGLITHYCAREIDPANLA
jgi:chemosensory pili system protein ChpA (sensor histidine kinase/response regulator)